MKPKNKVYLTLFGNLFLIIMIIILTFIFQSKNSTYFRFGPSNDLIVISVSIDTWTKYNLILLLIGFIKIVDTISNELGMPVLGFNIYSKSLKILDNLPAYDGYKKIYRDREITKYVIY